MMKLLVQYLAVGSAGFLGAITRLFVGSVFGRWLETSFPVGTLVINVTGSFILGWFITFVTEKYPVSDTLRLAIAVGFVGAYTTFSTFTYESTKLMNDRAWAMAIANIVVSLVLGLLAVRLGIMTARRV
ncbi:MAG TPA: fluoride efflux transporter CrcB [Tepidisphaeraceae bacterium]|jgi:CrcB protein|nr:fluoride efflux transporter CrcB [Tepidisphaeraceae bacterium]